MSNDKSLSELLQQAEALRAGIQTGEELPTVHRNLQQIAEAGHRLLDKISGAHVLDESTNAKASILLGSRGFDVPKLSQKLDSLNAAKTLEPIEPVWETDIQGFLRNERENALLAIVEESRRNMVKTFAEAERHHWRSLEEEWENEKEKILNSLLGASQELEVPSESKLLHTTPLSMHGRSGLDAVGMAYAREVFIRNESKLQKLSNNLVTTFHETSKGFVDKSITECWSLLKTIVDVKKLPAKAYEHRSSRMLQEAFVIQARQFLESSYLNFIQDTVYRSLSQAQLGGVPGTLSLVKSFLHLRQVSMMPGIEEELLDGQPLWALVFYCMRCGSMNDALNALRRAPTCSEFAGFLQEYIETKDHRLSPSSEAKLQNVYRCSVRNSEDLFKKAVYCVIARCDVGDNHTKVCTKTEDYMWLKLSQLHFDSNDDEAGHTPSLGYSHHVGDRLTLSSLQHTLLEEFGEIHFNAHQQPYLYFKVLLLTAQFEAAIEFLSRVEMLHTHAVHFAIALNDMKLLHLTESIQSKLLVKDPIGVYKLNFARLVMIYTKRFSLTDPREALHYFYLLKGIVGSQSLDLFNVCVSELVIESREFEMVLGRIQPDGSRKPGCLDKFEGDTSGVIQFVAEKAKEKGLFEDAVHLYDLAKDHIKVLELLNRLLSQVVSSPSAPQSDRDRLQSIAISIAERFKTSGHNATRQLSHTFFLLLDIMQFFDHYHSKRMDVAFDVIKQLHLLPLQAGETVDQKVAAFRSHDDEVRRCLPDTLLATMSILYSQYKQLSDSTPRGVFTQQDGGHEDRKKELRYLAKTLITFSGMIPYQMPGDTNARLVQMEVLMS